jgi:hypothetical protein
MARGNLQVGFSSRALLGPVQNLHQAELIPALPAAEFYRIHALTYKVQAQPPGAHILERAPAHLLGIHRHTAIFQDDFKSITAPAVPRHMNPAAGYLDGPFSVSEVGMANDICQRFVDGENYGMAFQFGKSQCRRELSQDISHHTEHLRITPQFHSQK